MTLGDGRSYRAAIRDASVYLSPPDSDPGLNSRAGPEHRPDKIRATARIPGGPPRPSMLRFLWTEVWGAFPRSSTRANPSQGGDAKLRVRGRQRIAGLPKGE